MLIVYKNQKEWGKKNVMRTSNWNQLQIRRVFYLYLNVKMPVYKCVKVINLALYTKLFMSRFNQILAC